MVPPNAGPKCLRPWAFFSPWPPILNGSSYHGRKIAMSPCHAPRVRIRLFGVWMSPAYASEWRSILLCFTPRVRAAMQQLVTSNSTMLALHFYEAMMGDEAAASFLSHEQVQNHLKPAMQRWLQEVYALDPEADLESVAQRQVKIGEIHARIDLPVYLVLRGASRIKEGIHNLMLLSGELNTQERLAATQLVMRVMDLAMEIMAQAYATSRERNSRSKEAYRLFALTQNVSTLRERRRAELLDWQNQCLFNHALGAAAPPMPKLSASDFGLWFRHKGAHVFQGLPETAVILQNMEHIDHVLLPEFERATPDMLVQRLGELREQARNIALNLEALFEHNSQMDAGRDVLTHLLNRKFLHVVLSKEVSYARESQTTFSVLTLDIDHFKRINDAWGHEGGDMVLQQISAILSTNSRGGDYVFRMGGEEFLLLLVDTSAVAALRMAEKLRALVERESFTLPRNKRFHVTISIGVATFDGHPDYQRILRQSDAALYAAKARGRNCVVSANEI